MFEINPKLCIDDGGVGGGKGAFAPQICLLPPRLLHCFAISLSFIKIMASLLTITTTFRQKTFLCMLSNCPFLTHGYSVGVFVSHRDHSISISAFFCVLIASSLLCAPGGNRLDQSRTSLVDFSREPVRPVYTLDLSFTC